MKIIILFSILVGSSLYAGQSAGKYYIKFDGTNLSSGICFYSLFINKNLIDSKRMLLINL